MATSVKQAETVYFDLLRTQQGEHEPLCRRVGAALQSKNSTEYSPLHSEVQQYSARSATLSNLITLIHTTNTQLINLCKGKSQNQASSQALNFRFALECLSNKVINQRDPSEVLNLAVGLNLPRENKAQIKDPKLEEIEKLFAQEMESIKKAFEQS